MKRRSCVLTFFLLLFISGSLYGQSWKEYADSAKSVSAKNGKLAIIYYNKAKSLIPPDSVYTETYCVICKAMALQYYSLHEYEKAIITCNEVKSIAQQLYTEINDYNAWACNLMGAIYVARSNYDSAKLSYLKAMAIAEKLFGTNSPRYAQICNSMGAFYHDLGLYKESEPLLLTAESIRKKLPLSGDEDVYAITCVALANLYRDLGQYDKAETYYLKAKERRSIGGKENSYYASSCNILADLYLYMHKYKQAEALYLEAKDIRETLNKDGYEYGQSCNNLCALYRDMGQYEKAEQLGLKAKEIYNKKLPEGHSSITINLNILGELYFAMAKYAEAEPYFLNARNQWLNSLGKDHPYFISNTEELARLYWKMKRIAAADSLYTEAFRSKRILLNKVFEFTNENEKQAYIENINGAADEYQSFYYSNKKKYHQSSKQYEMALLSRNLILSSGMQMKELIYDNGDSDLRASYNKWTNIKEGIAHLYANAGNAELVKAKVLEAQADSIEKMLTRRSTIFRQLHNNITWQDIRNKLNDHEAAIEFIEFNVTGSGKGIDSVLYAALILKKGMTEPEFVPLFEKKQLDALFSNNSSTNSNDNVSKLYATRGVDVEDNESKTVTHGLYSLVWKPLENKLSGIKTIYFAPAGLLHRIAFAALPLKNKKVLSDRYKLIQLATTAYIAEQQPAFIDSAADIVLYGGIDYDADSTVLKQSAAVYAINPDKTSRSLPDDLTRGGTFQYLEGTSDEVDQVGKLAKEAGQQILILKGKDAIEESFKQLNGQHSPAVIHIASHGFFFPDPSGEEKDKENGDSNDLPGIQFRKSKNPLYRSGLLFAGANNGWEGKQSATTEDGILTAYEVSNMFLPNTKLAVLSACETALGDIHGSEGVYGLQRAFKMAGVKNLVMSLWKVPDTETAEFMQAFYEKIFSGQSIQNAFYFAQSKMKGKYRNNPYKWAAWILVK